MNVSSPADASCMAAPLQQPWEIELDPNIMNEYISLWSRFGFLFVFCRLDFALMVSLYSYAGYPVIGIGKTINITLSLMCYDT